MVHSACSFSSVCFFHVIRSFLTSIIVVIWLMPQISQADERTAAVSFEKSVRPLLVAKCLKCHGEQKQEGNLRLDSREALLRGGESGPAVTAGNPRASLLIEAVRYDGLEMPPSGRLSDREIKALEAWIAGGAVWPENVKLLRASSGMVTDDDRNWWAFRPRHQTGGSRP